MRTNGHTVLSAVDLDYSDMTTVGRVEIYLDPRTHRIEIDVHGFEFAETQGCRPHAVRALAWVRDVLAARVELDRLTPGGEARVTRGLSQSELDANGRKCPGVE
ncbi:hypothetical protein PSP20601_02452 [Pandoraea sputorum]|nr:hypothetical protein PSP20601_02452 [Pandoraea sputorum]